MTGRGKKKIRKRNTPVQRGKWRMCVIVKMREFILKCKQPVYDAMEGEEMGRRGKRIHFRDHGCKRFSHIFYNYTARLCHVSNDRKYTCHLYCLMYGRVV